MSPFWRRVWRAGMLASIALVASSKTRIAGLLTSARASATA